MRKVRRVGKNYSKENNSKIAVIGWNTNDRFSENGYFTVSNELSIGDKVKSENGIVSVTAISQESTPQPVYNLLLVEEDMFIKADRNASLKIANGSELNWKQTLRKQYPFLGLSEQEHTFYINGIQSGDLVIQMSLLQ